MTDRIAHIINAFHTGIFRKMTVLIGSVDPVSSVCPDLRISSLCGKAFCCGKNHGHSCCPFCCSRHQKQVFSGLLRQYQRKKTHHPSRRSHCQKFIFRRNFIAVTAPVNVKLFPQTWQTKAIVMIAIYNDRLFLHISMYVRSIKA